MSVHFGDGEKIPVLTRLETRDDAVEAVMTQKGVRRVKHRGVFSGSYMGQPDSDGDSPHGESDGGHDVGLSGSGVELLSLRAEELQQLHVDHVPADVWNVLALVRLGAGVPAAFSNPGMLGNVIDRMYRMECITTVLLACFLKR